MADTLSRSVALAAAFVAVSAVGALAQGPGEVLGFLRDASPILAWMAVGALALAGAYRLFRTAPGGHDPRMAEVQTEIRLVVNGLKEAVATLDRTMDAHTRAMESLVHQMAGHAQATDAYQAAGRTAMERLETVAAIVPLVEQIHGRVMARKEPVPRGHR